MDLQARQKSLSRLRAWWLLIVLLMVVVFQPLFGGTAVGADYLSLAEASRLLQPSLDGARAQPVDFFLNSGGSAGRPLAALSLAVSSWIWTAGGVWTPVALGALRMENMILLLVCAYLLGRFVRRLVAAWTGPEEAAAAGHAAWLFLCIHPLSVSAVASPAARGDLLGGLCAVAAGTAFLRGRQEGSYRFVVLAAVCTLACSLASELGYLVPFWLALIEYYSSRRYRRGAVRMRTAFSTLLAFSAAASADIVLRAFQGLPAAPPDLNRSLWMFLDLGDMWLAGFHALEKLGVLMVPVNQAGAGGIGYILAVLVLVGVLRPALHAGRSAPRFWATVLLAWLVVVLLTASMRAFTTVVQAEFSQAAGLFPAVLVMVIGMGLAATAVSGRRRYGIPLVVALMLAVLARSNAVSWRKSADEARDFQEQVGEVIAKGGAAQRYLVVDAPGLTSGYRALPEALDEIFSRPFGFRDGAPNWLRLIDSSALVAFAREREFDHLRREGLVIVLRRSSSSAQNASAAEEPDEAEPQGFGRWRGQALEIAGLAPSVLAWRNADPDSEDEQSVFSRGHWVGVAGDVPYFADSSSIEQITVAVAGSEPTEFDDPPQIFWRARGGLMGGGDLRGVWLRSGEGRRAVFDPGGRLEWLLGPRLDSLLLIGSLAEAQDAEVWPTPPRVQGVVGFGMRGEDWTFLPRISDEELLFEGTSEWVVTLFDLVDWSYLEIPCEVDVEERVLAPEVEDFLRHVWSGRGHLAWSLERRVEGLVVARSKGRL
ncbi:MAG: hypothetical protein ABGY71_02010 [bacterium]|nr:hypothetical protein [Planctomycetota bacterium]HIL51177.1 hypothetical protein [Planctomycetota bacterium]